jgi:Asp-tRNA(Asn)/Glu-tRNA(Gln) amidotransferase A subunit family amidase
MKTKYLYHGGLEVIKAPEIRVPNRTLDFGQGFYLTSSEKQAEDWTRRRIEEQKENTGHGYVSTYYFDEENANTSIKIKRFDTPTEEWVDFVMANRRKDGFTHDYDIVIGPVANDRVYTSFSLFEGGVISKVTLIEELKTYRLVDQYLFHTNTALSFLKYVSSKLITND